MRPTWRKNVVLWRLGGMNMEQTERPPVVTYRLFLASAYLKRDNLAMPPRLPAATCRHQATYDACASLRG